MNREPYIAGDWGTSRLRLALCLGDRVLATRQGPGIGALREPAAEALLRALGEAALRFEADGASVVIAQVRDFVTALTGELFALPRDGSTLLRAANGEQCALAGLRTLWRP